MSNKIKLAVSVATILALSLTTIWSTAPKLLTSQLIFLVIGLVVYFLFTKIDIGLLLSISPLIYSFIIFSLIATLLLGDTIRGATRWLGPIQTSELAKPFLVIFFAYYLSKYGLKKLKNFVIYAILALIPVVLVKMQPDLGSALVILALAGFMALFLGVNLKIISIVILMLLVIIPIAPHFLKSYQLDRIQSFINPHEDPLGKGYNALQSVIAIGSGGLIGKGVLLGTQSHLNFLPERHTDFIFASFAEEFGLLGIILVVSAYFYLLFFLLSAASRFTHKEHRLVLLGILSIFIFQVIVNIGMNLGVLPVTGITLPLFSYGGSSLLSFMVLLGILMNLLELEPKFKI